jgi:hypothetical protein
MASKTSVPFSEMTYGLSLNSDPLGAGLVPAHAVVPAHDVVLSDDGSIVGASDHDVVPVNTRATTRVAPTLGHVIGTYKSLVTIQPFNCFFVSYCFSTPDWFLSLFAVFRFWTLDVGLWTGSILPITHCRYQ